jgi:hypothetical protein
MARPAAATRATALLALGALAVHELRYLLTYGGKAHSAMMSQGHGYLGELAPALVVLALSALCGRLATAALGRPIATGGSRPLWRTAATFAAALAAIFAAQELVEGAVFAGHAAGVAAVLGGGGWLALPLALLVGLITAIADRLLAGTERALLAPVRRRRRRRDPRALVLPKPYSRTTFVLRPLAFGLARRPPPAPRAI